LLCLGFAGAAPGLGFSNPRLVSEDSAPGLGFSDPRLRSEARVEKPEASVIKAEASDKKAEAIPHRYLRLTLTFDLRTTSRGYLGLRLVSEAQVRG